MQPLEKTSTKFDAIFDSVSRLELEEKRRLWQALDEEIGQAEEERWENNPAMRAELQSARTAHKDGDYVTLEEYLAEPNNS